IRQCIFNLLATIAQGAGPMARVQVQRVQYRELPHRCYQLAVVPGRQVPASYPSGEHRVPGQKYPLGTVEQADAADGMAWRMDDLEIVLPGGEDLTPDQIVDLGPFHPPAEHLSLGAPGGAFP